MIPVKKTRDQFKHYRRNGGKQDIAVWRNIISGFLKFLARKLLEGWDIHLSDGKTLGVLAIRGRKITPHLDSNGDIKGLAPNWQKTRELWRENPEAREKNELVYCFNEHTNYIRYKIKWIKEGMNIFNKKYYVFTISRPLKREASRLFKEGEEYLVID